MVSQTLSLRLYIPPSFPLSFSRLLLQRCTISLLLRPFSFIIKQPINPNSVRGSADNECNKNIRANNNSELERNMLRGLTNPRSCYIFSAFRLVLDIIVSRRLTRDLRERATKRRDCLYNINPSKKLSSQLRASLKLKISRFIAATQKDSDRYKYLQIEKGKFRTCSIIITTMWTNSVKSQISRTYFQLSSKERKCVPKLLLRDLMRDNVLRNL